MEAVSKIIDKLGSLTCLAALFLLANRGYAAQKTVREIIEISFETGGNSCGGQCADYKVTIRNDGTVTYEGRSNVKITGVKKISVPRNNFDLLARKVNEIGFFDLRDRYDGFEFDGGTMSITDLPTRIVTVFDKAGAEKTIVDYWGTPKRLYELEQLIDKLTTVSTLTGFTKDDDDDLPYYEPKFPMNRILKFRGVVSRVRYGGGASANAPKWTSAYELFISKNALQFELRPEPAVDLSQFDCWIVDATGKLTKRGVTGEYVFVASKIQRVRKSGNFAPSK